MTTKFGMAQPVRRVEDPRLLVGDGRYTDDIAPDGAAFGVVLRSPHANAKILSVDTSAAAAVPGVLLVATSQDLQADGIGGLPCDVPLNNRDGSPRADATGLSRVDAAALGQAFQVSDANPLAGLDGRAALLRGLGAALLARPDLFGPGRIGCLYDALATGSEVRATVILAALLDGLGPIWPSRIVRAGRPLGDVWHHPSAPDDGLVPFHKLSQWLTYSLVEVFEDAGIAVTGLATLTGLPEYRNGGLLLDLGALRLRDPALARELLPVGHEEVVEWRALTVALLDRLAPLIRVRLGRDEAALPLSRLLEGGTWAAGRAVAAERRPSGGPPLRVVSDGTVF